MLLFKKLSVAAIALGQISLVFISVPSIAAPPGGCPAFNTAMVDAAWLAIDYSQPGPPELLDLNDDPAEPNMLCVISTDVGSEFSVYVGGGEAGLMGRGINIDNPDPITTLLRTRVFNLNKAEEHACRAQVLASFAWKQYCSPPLP